MRLYDFDFCTPDFIKRGVNGLFPNDRLMALKDRVAFYYYGVLYEAIFGDDIIVRTYSAPKYLESLIEGIKENFRVGVIEDVKIEIEKITYIDRTELKITFHDC